jgi:hypothetical protein
MKWSAIESFIPSRLDLSRFAQEASEQSFEVGSESRAELRITHKGGGMCRAGGRDYRAKGMTALHTILKQGMRNFRALERGEHREMRKEKGEKRRALTITIANLGTRL